MRNVSDTFVEKIKTHILCSVTFFRHSCRLGDNVEKYCIAVQATGDNMAHAHCMLNIFGYKYTHSSWPLTIALPLQQWLHERALLLQVRSTCTAGLVLLTPLQVSSQNIFLR
jgi:hypothetical protein